MIVDLCVLEVRQSKILKEASGLIMLHFVEWGQVQHSEPGLRVSVSLEHTFHSYYYSGSDVRGIQAWS